MLAVIGRGLVWLLVFSGAIVYREPAPYELLAVATIVFFFLVLGLTFVRETLPLFILILLFVIGGLFGALQGDPISDAMMYMAVTAFLAGTSIFFATYLAERTPERMDLILNAYGVGAIVAAIAGIIGYFHLLPGSDMFTLYGRARGTFQDPNPYGAFLILAPAFALQRLLIGKWRDALFPAAVFAIAAIAVLLSFSRAAWGMLILVCLIVVVATFLLTPSKATKGRIIVLVILGVVLAAVAIGVALSIPQIRTLLMERASLVQSYDAGPQGRFGRYLPGLLLVIEKPFGIGPGGFSKIFPEDPHNTYLKAFIEYSWLSGTAFLVLIGTTFAATLKRLIEPGPYRWYFVPVFAAFAANTFEAFIIDIDHWRHYYLLIGLCWGLIAAHERAKRRAPGVMPTLRR